MYKRETESPRTRLSSIAIVLAAVLGFHLSVITYVLYGDSKREAPRIQASNLLVDTLTATTAVISQGTGAFTGTVSMADPTLSSHGVTLNYFNAHNPATTASFSSDFGTGVDGNVTCFDGVTTCLGFVPASATYTFTRHVEAQNATVADGVRIKLNGFHFLGTGTLTGGTTTPCQIDDNGASAVNTNSGAAARSAGWYAANVGGGSTGGAGVTGTVIGPPFTDGTTHTGGAGGTIGNAGGLGTGTCTGGGGGGGTGAAGSSGGNASTYTAANQPAPGAVFEQGAGGRSFTATALSGGGGGGGGGGAATGGGGGAGGGMAYVAFRKLAGKINVQANGGAGSTAFANGGGGGGGAGGGEAWLEYVTNTGPGAPGNVTVSATGGAGGSGNGAGTGPGAAGNNCITVRLNLSNDGT